MNINDSFIQIHWTCGDFNEAKAIAGELVRKRLVACAHVIPSIESIFYWEGNLESANETTVIFKTCEEKFDQVKNFIIDHASYDVPEILKIPITGGNEDYLKWVKESTS